MKKYLVETWTTETRYMEVKAINKDKALEKFIKALENGDEGIDEFSSEDEFKVQEVKENE